METGDTRWMDGYTPLNRLDRPRNISAYIEVNPDMILIDILRVGLAKETLNDI